MAAMGRPRDARLTDEILTATLRLSTRKGRMKVLVRPVYGAIAPNADTVRVMSGTKRIGSATVHSGVAVVTIRRLPRKAHRIKVRYLGSANHLASVKKLRLVVRR